jgi:hypothetical protein
MLTIRQIQSALNQAMTSLIEDVPADNWFAERHRGRLEIRDKSSYQLIRTIEPPAGWNLWNWKVGDDGRTVVLHHHADK